MTRRRGERSGRPSGVVGKAALLLSSVLAALAWLTVELAAPTGGLAEAATAASSITRTTDAPAHGTGQSGQGDVESAVEFGAGDVTIDAWQSAVGGPGLGDPAAQAKQGSRKSGKAKARSLVGGSRSAVSKSASKGSAGVLASGRSGPRRQRPHQGVPGPGGGVGFRQAGDENSVFQFRTRVDTAFRVTVQTTAGAPLPMARVLLLRALVPPPAGLSLEDQTSPDGWFDGFTDSLGVVQGVAPLPTSVAVVDVVVLAAGMSGDYTHESLRALFGPFAPAARITVPLSQLDGLTVLLAPE